MVGSIILDGFYFFKVFSVRSECPKEYTEYNSSNLFNPIINNTLNGEGVGH